MSLTKEENAKFEENIKKSPKKMYGKTIQVLMDIYHEDRLVIYTLLSVLGGYIQNIDFSQKERDNHVLMINSMYEDFDIKEPKDLIKSIDNCMINIQNSKMRHTIGGVQ